MSAATALAEPADARLCVFCDGSMLVETGDRHAVCCRAAGGLAVAAKPCNPHRFGKKRDNEGIAGCAVCYLGGTAA